MHVIFSTYLQNVATLPRKITNTYKGSSEVGYLQITGSKTVISTCIEYLTA